MAAAFVTSSKENSQTKFFSYEVIEIGGKMEKLTLQPLKNPKTSGRNVLYK